MGVDLEIALFAVDPGVALGARHESRALEIDLGRSAAMAVIDRLGGARDDVDAVDRHPVHALHLRSCGCNRRLRHAEPDGGEAGGDDPDRVHR